VRDPVAWQLALIMVAIFAGAIVQGSVGFGFALVSAAAVGLIQPDAIPATLLLLSFPVNVFIGVRERRALDVVALREVTVGLMLGTPVGAMVLIMVPGELLVAAFGAAIVAAAGISIARPRAEPGTRGRVVAGAVSGVISTVASTGGPPIALLFQRRPGPQLRATLAAAFFVSATLSTIGVTVAGRLGWQQARLALFSLPALVAGLVLSGPIGRRVDDRWLRPAVLVFAVGSGVAAIIRVLV